MSLFGMIAYMCEKVSYPWSVNAFDDADAASMGGVEHQSGGYAYPTCTKRALCTSREHLLTLTV